MEIPDKWKDNRSAVITSTKVLFTGMDGNVYILGLQMGKNLEF